jgi:hypothetical protein
MWSDRWDEDDEYYDHFVDQLRAELAQKGGNTVAQATPQKKN